MGPNLSMSSKTSIYFTKRAIRCINILYYNAHTEPLFIRNKILKLDDLYKFELSKFMFDCTNCFLPTTILEHFTTNATIHAHHTRQRNIPHVTQTFGTISKRAVTNKGPNIWTEIPQTIRLDQNKNTFSRLLKKRLHHKIQLNVLLMLYIELLGTIIVVSSVGGMRGCVVGVAVMSPRGWVCLGETLVFVCLLPVLISCVRSCSGWVRPALSRWCSLVVLPAVCECARGRWADQAVIWHVYCEQHCTL